MTNVFVPSSDQGVFHCPITPKISRMFFGEGKAVAGDRPSSVAILRRVDSPRRFATTGPMGNPPGPGLRQSSGALTVGVG